MLDDFFTETLTVRVATYANVKGERVPTFAETTLLGAVQPMSASRIHMHGVESSDMAHTCYAASWPSGLKVGDTILWTDRGVTLQVLGKPRDEGGAHEVFGLDCLELS